MTYDPVRRNELVDKFVNNKLILNEAQELQRYLKEDEERLRGTSGEDDAAALVLIILALIGVAALIGILTAK